MTKETARLEADLVRKYLGKQGIHGVNVDEESQTVNVFLEPGKASEKAVLRLRKDAEPLDVRMIEGPRARLI